MTSGRTIYDRIDQAYAEIAKAVFAKSGRVQGSASYAYIPIGQMLEIVRQAHARAGVKVLLGRPEYDPDMGEGRREMRMQRTNPVTGKPYETIEYYAVGHMAVRILGAGPDDCIETEVGFEARDNSDKLTNKIYTNVERNLYRTLYAIDEGGPDPEAENIPISRQSLRQTPGRPQDGHPGRGQEDRAPHRCRTRPRGRRALSRGLDPYHGPIAHRQGAGGGRPRAPARRARGA